MYYSFDYFLFRQPPEKICCEDLAVAVPGECLFPELAEDNELASQEEEKGILVYTDSTDGMIFIVFY